MRVRSRLREAVAFTVRFSGLPFLIRHLIVRRRATIVLYHDPTPEILDRHLAYLSRRYDFTTLDALVSAIEEGDWSGMPRRPLVVTIDDGHRGNARLLDIFERYRVRPMLYLCSQIVTTNRHFWFEDVVGWQAVMNLPNAARLEHLEQETGFRPTREYSPADRQALSAGELALASGRIDFGSHTRFHPILTTCDNEECAEEIVRSRQEVEDQCGEPCRHFSYPNGDYTERELALVRRAGYRSARTVDVGWNGPRTDPFRLRITGVSDDATVNVLAAQLGGVAVFLRYLRRGSLTGRYPPIIPEGTS